MFSIEVPCDLRSKLMPKGRLVKTYFLRTANEYIATNTISRSSDNVMHRCIA